MGRYGWRRQAGSRLLAVVVALLGLQVLAAPASHSTTTTRIDQSQTDGSTGIGGGYQSWGLTFTPTADNIAGFDVWFWCDVSANVVVEQWPSGPVVAGPMVVTGSHGGPVTHTDIPGGPVAITPGVKYAILETSVNSGGTFLGGNNLGGSCFNGTLSDVYPGGAYVFASAEATFFDPYFVTYYAASDTTPPTISFSQSPNGNSNWFTTASATVSVTATDGDASGVATLVCAVDGVPVTLTNTGTTATTMSGDVSTSVDGDHLVSCEATDAAGNAAAYADNQTHLMLDATAPTVTCAAITPSFTLNQSAAVMSATVTDATSGPKASPVSASVSTAPVGSFNASLTGEDLAGKSTTKSCPYTVNYGIKALYTPAKVNKPGANVVIKIQLVDAAGADVSTPVVVLTVTGLSPSPAPGVAPPAGTNFVFTTFATGPGYQLNVKTTKYPRTTYTLTFTAGSDPTAHTASFIIG